jgi:hypothetical protein
MLKATHDPLQHPPFTFEQVEPSAALEIPQVWVLASHTAILHSAGVGQSLADTH